MSFDFGDQNLVKRILEPEFRVPTPVLTRPGVVDQSRPTIDDKLATRHRVERDVSVGKVHLNAFLNLACGHRKRSHVVNIVAQLIFVSTPNTVYVDNILLRK